MNYYDFPDTMAFTILHYNVKLFHIDIVNRKVSVRVYDALTHIHREKVYVFYEPEEQTYDTFIWWLHNRTLPESNPRWPSLYAKYGLAEYKPFEAVKITHGTWNFDGDWLLFDDDWCGQDFRVPIYCKQGCRLLEDATREYVNHLQWGMGENAILAE